MRILFILIFLYFPATIKAPESKTLFISEDTPIKPYTAIINAIGAIETNHDTLAVNVKEQAYGYFQIRQIRLDDYFYRTGVNYNLPDMLNYRKAERVFMYYALAFRYDDYRGIAREWNKSKTDKYWKKVKQSINKTT